MKSEVCGAYTVHTNAWRNGCGLRLGVTVGLRDVSQQRRPWVQSSSSQILVTFLPVLSAQTRLAIGGMTLSQSMTAASFVERFGGKRLV